MPLWCFVKNTREHFAFFNFCCCSKRSWKRAELLNKMDSLLHFILELGSIYYWGNKFDIWPIANRHQRDCPFMEVIQTAPHDAVCHAYILPCFLLGNKEGIKELTVLPTRHTSIQFQTDTFSSRWATLDLDIPKPIKDYLLVPRRYFHKTKK